MSFELICWWAFILALGFQLWWWFKATPETKERLRAVKKAGERAAMKGAGRLAWWAIRRKW